MMLFNFEFLFAEFLIFSEKIENNFNCHLSTSRDLIINQEIMLSIFLQKTSFEIPKNKTKGNKKDEVIYSQGLRKWSNLI
jgi:hypothetical protein